MEPLEAFWPRIWLPILDVLSNPISDGFSFTCLVLIAKLELYVTQKLVNVAKLQKFLIGYDKDELEFIVQLVLQREGFVGERLEATAFLQYHTLDQGIDWRCKRLTSALKTPQHQAALAENSKKIQHIVQLRHKFRHTKNFSELPSQRLFNTK